jgi:hypothetical protein
MRKLIVAAGVLALALAARADTVVISSGLTTQGSDFVTSQTPDNTIQFGYNWVSDALNSLTGYSTVPASPGGDAVGLKITSNNTDDPTDYQEGVTVFCTTEPQTTNYDVEVDTFIAWPITGSGTTEHIGIVIQSSGNGIRCLRNDALAAVNPAFGYSDISTTAGTYLTDGLAFGYNSDSDEIATEIFCYDPAQRTGQPSTIYNGQVGSYVLGDPSPFTNHNFGPTQYESYLSPPVGRDASLADTAGHLWNRLKASVRGDMVSFYMNGKLVLFLNSANTAKRVGLIAGDPFSGPSTPAADSYMLFDNFKITDVTPSAGARDWQLFE